MKFLQLVLWLSQHFFFIFLFHTLLYLLFDVQLLFIFRWQSHQTTLGLIPAKNFLSFQKYLFTVAVYCYYHLLMNHWNKHFLLCPENRGLNFCSVWFYRTEDTYHIYLNKVLNLSLLALKLKKGTEQDLNKNVNLCS